MGKHTRAMPFLTIAAGLALMTVCAA